MAKSARVTSTNHGRPITAFFAPANRGGRPLNSSADAPLSSQSQSGSQGVQQSSKSKSTNGLSATKVTYESKDSEAQQTRRSERRANQQTSFLSPGASVPSLKRVRTPDAQLRSPSKTGNPKPRTRRTNKFDTDSDSDANNLNRVVYVKSPNSQHRKKARLSPPFVSSQISNTALIPSSQSNEEELPSAESQQCLSTALSNDIITRFALPSPHPDEDDFAMAVDDDQQNSSSRFGQHESMKLVSPENPIPIGPMLTPPLSDLSPLPPTPNPVSKITAADIIANIKARAYAKILSSPELDEVDFKIELASSDEEDLPVVPLPSTKVTRKEENNVISGPAIRRSTRLSLRHLSGSPTESLRPDLVADHANATKKKPSVIPFTSLLREKRQAEKHGITSDNIDMAESTALQYGKDSLMDEMDDEEDDGDPSEWGPSISSLGVRGILTSRPHRRDDPDLTLEDEDRERIIEEDGGKTILDILEKDKAEKIKSGSPDKTSGIQLWRTGLAAESSALAVNEPHCIPGNSPYIRLLNGALQCGDIARSRSLLNMGLMLSVTPAERAGLASCLCDIALSSRPSVCGEAAANTLEQFWSSSIQPAASSISFKDVLSCLSRLGADPSILSTLPWSGDGIDMGGDVHDRDSILRRLITLLTACARSHRLRKEEVPDIILALMLVAMDSGAPPGLCRDLVQAIDASICCHSTSKENEFELSVRFLRLSTSYSPVNKLRLLSFLSNGSGTTCRIAKYVAFCVITDKRAPTIDTYMEFPPLVDVIEQLQPYSRSTSSLPGKFALYKGTDYIDVGFYIAILGIAVTDLNGYVAQERQKPKSCSAFESPGRAGEKPKTELQQLHAALETLHASISDTRAMHLERSKTKAAIKQLAMNIHYQREFWLRNGQDTKSKTLAQYFIKKN